MSTVEILNLPIDQKIQILEAIWNDLHSHADREKITDWQKNTLDERQADFRAGKEELLDWDKIKNQLGKR